MRRLLAMICVVALALALASCGGGDTTEGTITVFAAASLTDAMTAVAEAFEAANPDVSVALSFAGSSSLREQILAGAPADVFASADESNMDQVVAAGEVTSSTVFATNRLQIAVPAGNPAGVTGIEDFAEDDLLIGLCAEQVPCGQLARRVLAAANVTPSPDTREPDVRALLTKIEAGEVDAGLVYVTDVAAAGDGVVGIDLPDDLDSVVAYPIGTVDSTGNPDAAAAFVELVLGAEGQAILERFGFGPP